MTCPCPDFKTFLREDAPGIIPSAVIAAGLLALGLLILRTRAEEPDEATRSQLSRSIP